LIQNRARSGNIDSKAHAPRFDCFKFQFHSICSETFATQSAHSDALRQRSTSVAFGAKRILAEQRLQKADLRLHQFRVASGSRCAARRRRNSARAAANLLAQCGHFVFQPGLGSHQFRAALADDGARRAKRGSSNAWRLKPNSRRSAGASTSTRSRESYATRSCASENFTAKSSPTASARRSAGSTRKSKRNELCLLLRHVRAHARHGVLCRTDKTQCSAVENSEMTANLIRAGGPMRITVEAAEGVFSAAVRAMECVSMPTIVRCPRTGRACREVTCRERHWCRQMLERGLSPRGLPLKRKYRPRCRAKTRAGVPCIMRVVPGKQRCRFHGGLSTGPKTVEGRARIAEAQRRRWRAFRAANAKSQRPLSAPY